MYRQHFFISNLSLILMIAACSSEVSAPITENTSIAGTVPQVTVDSIEKEQGTDNDKNKANNDEQTVKDSQSLLADGSHMAYGLKMPGGMIPISTPDKHTSRFEGTHDIAMLKRYILFQVQTERDIIKEGNGSFLIRQAKIIRPHVGDDTSFKLAIRIFNGSLGGGSVDVWKEREPSVDTKVLRSPTPLLTNKVLPSTQTTDTAIQADFMRSPKTREQRILEVMNKLEKREELTPEDLNSPYFY